MSESKAYAAAGVDIDAASRTKARIKELVRSTFGPEVLTDIGGFGGLYAPPFQSCKNPVLVASADGVGTKLKIAFLTGTHHTVGADLVAHCANDILVQGARPLFFLDYLAMGTHEEDVAAAVVEGIARGCRDCGCALLGGEMAEMPDFYAPGEYDLAGTIVGMTDRDRILDGRSIRPGDRLIGLASSGLHTNGYSLARKLLFEAAGWSVDTHLDQIGCTIGEALLAPHRNYVKPIFSLMESVEVRGMAHITGGGLVDNLPRSLPSNLGAQIDRKSWPSQPLFDLLLEIGDDISEMERYRVFNMGLGMVLVVDPGQADRALEILQESGEKAYIVGEIVEGPNQTIEIL